MLDFIKNPRGRYAHVGSPTSTTSHQWNMTFVKNISIVIGALVLCAISFAFGRHTVPSGVQESISLSDYTYAFKYDRIFGERPNETSDAAWSGLFPEGGGFLIHPEIAPKRSAIAVFHQLHCLDGLRNAIWTMFDKAVAGEKLVVDDLPEHLQPPHMRHCIDLLRQSLMCRPDLSIEVVNMTLGGVTGFGTEHQCKRWDQLVSFAREWQYYGLSGYEAEMRKMNGGHLAGGHNSTHGGHGGHGK